MMVKIKPITILNKTYTQLYIDTVDVILNVQVNILYTLATENRELLGYQKLVLSGEDYNKWSDDDSYIIKKVAQALGVELDN
jgi:hypothetical protein